MTRRGHQTVDTDYDGFSEFLDDFGKIWREDRIDTLINEHKQGALFNSGTVSNQWKFYSQFNAIVLIHTNSSLGFSYESLSRILFSVLRLTTILFVR